MKESKADLILHPVRVRIIGLLAGGRRLTARQMVERLGNVPQPSLYRHLKKLVKGGVLAIEDERRVRGAVERVYGLAVGRAQLTAEDLAGASPDDHMRYFMTFIASLLDDFASYLEQQDIDLLKDGVGYGQVPLYLSEREFDDVAGQIRDVLTRAAANQPTAGRRRRTFSTIVMPEPEMQNRAGRGVGIDLVGP